MYLAAYPDSRFQGCGSGSGFVGIRIRIDLALLVPDPELNENADPDPHPDPGARKSTKILKFTRISNQKKASVPALRSDVL